MVLALTVSLGLVSCGADEAREEETFVGADEVCDGLFDGPLAKQVELVTGDTEFFAMGAEGGAMSSVVDALKRGYASGRSWATGGDLCELDPKGGRLGEGADIKVSMYAPQDVEDSRDQAATELYTMGKRSEVGERSASLYLECVSPQIEGSEEIPLRIHGGFDRGESSAPDSRRFRNANMEILHAGALALVKELDCKDRAGLPETPVLQPK
ncbi:hypothetical protein [Streptomyces sp. JH34]|uniref:hypothetical protein n=1 Tax=Streptomyces sp. JH34 TaxID=2793633 RepID=UPI0023F8EA6D|nr:hypothetical protein [Streptomyces sp. JH34]MDF6020734.1 hypothetical protein [Streptomyces sp. JH34]